MTPGQVARSVLGPAFKPVGAAYRRLFVNLDCIVDAFEPHIPPGARLLDIGGGDGALIDRLLARRPDVRVTMCDIAPTIGSFLSDSNAGKVTLVPGTDFAIVDGPFDLVMITDVLHHVPITEREGFFAALAASCDRWGARRLCFKDVEPGHVRSLMSLLADWYITGDRHVVLFSREDFGTMAARHFPRARRASSMPDAPNYCEILSW